MSAQSRACSPQWLYIDGELRKRGLTGADLARGTGVPRSCMAAWRNGGSVSVPTARALAAFLELPILDVLVGTRILTEHEARSRPAVFVDVAEFTDLELVAEIRERLRRRFLLIASAPPQLLHLLVPGGGTSSPSSGRVVGRGARTVVVHPRA